MFEAASLCIFLGMSLPGLSGCPMRDATRWAWVPACAPMPDRILCAAKCIVDSCFHLCSSAHSQLTEAMQCCRDAFNELTDCSTRLLDHGDYNAHSNTREQLQSDLRKQEQGDDIDMFALGESGRVCAGSVE